MPASRNTVTSWGGVSAAATEVQAERLAAVARHSRLVRGLGRSYGDSSLPADGVESVVRRDLDPGAEDGALRLILGDGVAGSSVLKHLVSFLDVHEFTSEEPDLETIFIKAVQDGN